MSDVGLLTPPEQIRRDRPAPRPRQQPGDGLPRRELIRRFSELSNETAGEHVTPRGVIRLMVNLLFIEDDGILAKPGAKATLYDPACGTGGMLSVAEEVVRSHNPHATLTVDGQELSSESYAICRSDRMVA